MEEAMKVTNLTRVFKGAGGEFTALKISISPFRQENLPS